MHGLPTEYVDKLQWCYILLEQLLYEGMKVYINDTGSDIAEDTETDTAEIEYSINLNQSHSALQECSYYTICTPIVYVCTLHIEFCVYVT